MEKTQVFCQSCAMPMTKTEEYGTNADGGRNEEYCCYCYKDGKFIADCTMEQMIDFCLDIQKKEGEARDKDRKAMLEYFPTLRRWRK